MHEVEVLQAGYGVGGFLNPLQERNRALLYKTHHSPLSHQLPSPTSTLIGLHLIPSLSKKLETLFHSHLLNNLSTGEWSICFFCRSLPHKVTYLLVIEASVCPKMSWRLKASPPLISQALAKPCLRPWRGKGFSPAFFCKLCQNGKVLWRQRWGKCAAISVGQWELC